MTGSPQPSVITNEQRISNLRIALVSIRSITNDAKTHAIAASAIVLDDFQHQQQGEQLRRRIVAAELETLEKQLLSYPMMQERVELLRKILAETDSAEQPNA